jgi:3-deoxy-manno-octulosonate cytidylyltransferase (CMP-KDO synthetase)
MGGVQGKGPMVPYFMQIVGVIPARFGSQRFPGKPLTKIGSKPLIQWVIEGASESKKIQKIIVATDDQRISDVVEGIGTQAIMTASDLPTGSDRVWQAAAEVEADVIVNIQGDEPLISGEILDALVAPFSSEDIDMCTLGRPLELDELENPNTAKIVLNKNNEAIYFSRLPIPYSRNSAVEGSVCCLKHIGIYAYRKKFLKDSDSSASAKSSLRSAPSISELLSSMAFSSSSKSGTASLSNASMSSSDISSESSAWPSACASPLSALAASGSSSGFLSSSSAIGTV